MMFTICGERGNRLYMKVEEVEHFPSFRDMLTGRVSKFLPNWFRPLDPTIETCSEDEEHLAAACALYRGMVPPAHQDEHGNEKGAVALKLSLC